MAYVAVCGALSVPLALCAAGCAFDPSAIGGRDGGTTPDTSLPDVALPADAAQSPVDAESDAGPCTPWPFTPTNVDPCELPSPEGNLVVTTGAYSYDTDTGVLTAPSGATSTPVSTVLVQGGSFPEVRAVVVRDFTVGATSTLRVRGSRALAIVAWGTVTIVGSVDVSADTGASASAPGADVGCGGARGTNATDATNATAGAGGGGGGGFGNDGGDGGDGADSGSGKGTKGAKGGQVGNAQNSPLRGGCPGGRGGNSSATGGGGGGGGGALQISARDAIVLESTATVSAGGAGGLGGEAGSNMNSGGGGGGGGGSGGAIFLESASVTVKAAARVCANGGSGGEGSHGSSAGTDGVSGSCSATSPATTVGIVLVGGDGGNGSVGDGTGQNAGNGSPSMTGSSAGGGGGGGGGPGRIRIRGVATRNLEAGAVISPTATE